MKTLGDYSLAVQMRDAITQIATKVVNDLRPRDAYAKVISIDTTNARCEVQYRGEPGTIFIPMGTVRPTKAGQRVRISGPKGDRYISDVVSTAGGTTTASGGGFTTAGTSTTVTPIIPYVRSGILTVATGVTRFPFPFAATLVGVSAGVSAAPTGSSILIDVNKNGASIWANAGNKPVIAAGAFSTLSEASPDIFNVARGDYLTVDVDQVGSSVPGSELTVLIRYRQT